MLEELIERIHAALDYLMREAKSELRAQGHYASGRLEQSFEKKIDASRLSNIQAEILQEKYGLALDTGVPSSRVNYNPMQLIGWARIVKPGLSLTELTRFVYATKRVHERTGIPSPGSYSYTQNGRRTEWTKYAYEQNFDTIEKMLDFGAIIQETVDRYVQEVNEAA